MADDLELAIRIRADVKSAIDGLSKAEAELKDVGQAAGKGARGVDGFRRRVTQLVSGDLLARGITAMAQAAREMVVQTVRAGVEAQSLADSMRAATGTSAARELVFVGREAACLGLDLPAAESGMMPTSPSSMSA